MSESESMSSTIKWMRSRLAWMLGGASHNGKRNYNEDFGYPVQVTVKDLADQYERNGIASRVIRAYPAATWEETPIIRDDAGDSAEPTKSDGTKNPNYSPFVAAVQEFFRATGSMRYLERVDRLSSIGRFGILIMGFRDGKPLSEPLGSGKSRLIYLQAWGEPHVQILDYEKDTTNERFSMPTMYQVNPMANGGDGSGGPVPASFKVHYTRVIHVAEFLDSSEVLGQPRLMPIYNNLLDLAKTLGAGAEAFYRLANPGIAFTADADARIDQSALDNMKAQAEEYENNMRRILALQGVTPHTLGTTSQTADPSSQVDKLLDIIAGATGIPKRILIGTERGELASSQDSDSWASRIDERQNNYATPVILLPFLTKMVDTGNLIAPKGSIRCEWPDSGALSPKDQAEVGRIKAEALSKYASSSGAELIVPIPEFRRDILQLPPESEYEIPDELEDIEDPTDSGDLVDPPDDTSTDPSTEDTPDQMNANVYRLPQRVTPVGLTLVAQRRHLNAAPRTLYVRRDLLNAEEVRAFYRKQGLDAMVEASKMHVTVAFSRTPVDWFAIGECWTDGEGGRLTVKAGGPRMLDLLGDKRDVLALLFASSSLSWRHEDMKGLGCSWDYPTYQPHVSLTWQLGNTLQERQDRLTSLEPYTGELVFGPEVFEEVKVDWQKTIKENSSGKLR